MKMRKKKLSKPELILTIISLSVLVLMLPLEWFYSCFTQKYALTLSIISGIASGILTAIFLLYLQERHYYSNLKKYYSVIDGFYERIDMGQDNTTDEEFKSSKNQNLGLTIRVTYLGSHDFEIHAEYWKMANAKVKGTVSFNENNGMMAVGRYRYTDGGDDFMGHSGTYTIYRLEEDKTKLLVLYQHVYPRKINFDPDNNRGWEIWQRRSSFNK